jgi:hypothetical protein
VIVVVKYGREYEFILETALAHESGESGVLYDKNISDQKSRKSVPLSRTVESKY